MTALFEQFLVESREILETANAGLLRLERNHADADAVNEVFRAFHTLKGATGLFDWPVFTRLLHAAEDLLATVRDGRSSVTPGLIDGLFAVLDQAARWIDHIEAHGGLPGDAAGAARALQTSLSGGGPAAGAAGSGELPALFDWVVELTPGERAAVVQAAPGAEGTLTAVAYDPDPDCFFNGDDPLAVVRRIPGLVLLRIEPVTPWPPLAGLDPYRCLLRLRALTTAPESEVAALFRSAPDQVRFAAVPPARLAGPDSTVAGPAAAARALAAAMLREQRRILDLPPARGAGDGDGDGTLNARIAATARAAGNILTALGRGTAVAALHTAAAQARTTGLVEPLAAHLAGLADAVEAPAVPAPSAPVTPAPSGAAGRRALRIEPERIDRLMGLVGQLAVTKNRLPVLLRRAADPILARGLREVQDEMDGLIDDLQDAVLRLRMLPLDRVLQPLPRLVRDLAGRLGKSVDLRVEGEATEADKDVLDALGEPLLHLVRNAVDHGIESPEQRRAVGKPETGVIRITARQDRDGIVIDVADDGAGVDADKVLRTAVERGTVTADRAAALTRQEALALILLPGVSTAGTVTDVSGRGVGMDAVRTAIVRTGGSIAVDSVPGEGTRISLTLPLTMLVTPVMVVSAGGSLFGVPTSAVSEVARIRTGDIRRVKQAESVVLRDAVVPLLRLDRLLGLAGGTACDEATVLVLHRAAEPVGLVVDGVVERLDAVLKPLTGVLAGLRAYAGTTELGDGRLVPVINPRELL
ncbi:chemotaxis protein CheA [Azospirillum halopraeferens]|uniref:chemotaxis protein CheA n=1 Tax=Azospirillum halopraeferens TaxID=34010 RepID=UPI00040643AD|nr:chemotaxis protein CheA [Azospirillum halopraeferens]